MDSRVRTLHSDVGSETGLGDAVTNSRRVVSLLSSGELQGDPVGDDGRVSVSDVGEGTGVDEDGSSLKRLHDGGLDGVLHEDGKGARAADVVGRDGLAGLRGRDDHLTESAAGFLASAPGFGSLS